MRKKLTPYLEIAAEFLLIWILSVLALSTVMLSVHLVAELFKLLFNPINPLT